MGDVGGQEGSDEPMGEGCRKAQVVGAPCAETGLIKCFEVALALVYESLHATKEARAWADAIRRQRTRVCTHAAPKSGGEAVRESARLPRNVVVVRVLGVAVVVVHVLLLVVCTQTRTHTYPHARATYIHTRTNGRTHTRTS
eukprot:3324071-Pleurochrysis_carterae.AAC.1